MSKPLPKPRKQVAALPVRQDENGDWRVLLLTSRETRRLIVPKGWPMKGRKDYQAAAMEALEEAGVVGRIHRKPAGFYFYWKRQPDRFLFCKVRVYVLEVERQVKMWREKGQRQFIWLSIDEAAERIDDAGLVPIIRSLPARLPRRKAGQASVVR